MNLIAASDLVKLCRNCQSLSDVSYLLSFFILPTHLTPQLIWDILVEWREMEEEECKYNETLNKAYR